MTLVSNGERNFTLGLFPGCVRLVKANPGVFDRLLPLKGQVLAKKARVVTNPLDFLFAYFFPAAIESIVAHYEQNGACLSEWMPADEANDTDLRLQELIRFLPVNRPLIRGLFAANVLVGTKRDLTGRNPRRPPLTADADPSLGALLSLEEFFLLSHYPEYLAHATDFYLKRGLSLYQFFPLDRCKGIDDLVRVQVRQL